MKAWKHEKACARSEALIEDTVQKSEKPGWGTCATLVITALRKKKSKEAPLALHFIAVSATEMLSERHDNARLCLGAAMAVADPRLMMLQQRLFQAAFSRDAQGQLGPGAGAPGHKVVLVGRKRVRLPPNAEPCPDITGHLGGNGCPRFRA